MRIRNLAFLFVTVCMFSCGRDSIDDRLSRQSREYTMRHCPERMDDYTMLDSMVYVAEGRILNYYYLLQDSNVTDDGQRLRLKAFLEEIHLENLKQNLAFHDLKEHNVCFRYHYSSSSTKEEIMLIELTPNDYK